MLFIRSLLFNVSFLLVSIIEMVLCAPVYFLLPRRYVWIVPKFWARSAVFLLRYIAGIKIEIQGLEHISAIKELSKSYIIAPKHQSALETFVLLAYLDDPSYVLKRELTFIPLFGWYMAKTGIIAINRGEPLQALKQLITKAKNQKAKNRQILIFPEGTRSQPGDKPVYRAGIFNIYKDLKIPVLPIAHNSGLYWPKNSFYRYSGTLIIRFLPLIDIDLDKKQFLEQLKNKIEDNCNELLIEVVNQPNSPPLAKKAIKKLLQHNL